MPDSTGVSAAEKKRIKVAVLVGALEVGGAELDIVRNFPRVNRDEFEVFVVSFGTRGALAPELERQGIRVIARLPEARPAAAQTESSSDSRFVAWVKWRLETVVDMAESIPWIARTLAQERVDVVHFFLPYAYAYGMFACAFVRPRPKLVMSRLSLNFYAGAHKMLSWLERHVFHPRLDIAIGNSSVILDELIAEGVGPSHVRRVYNGVDTSVFAVDEEARMRARAEFGLQGAFVLVAVGNLHAYKGHADLIEACALAAEQLPPTWRLRIAGRDEKGNRAVCERLVAERGLAEHVMFLGEREDVPRLLMAADVFVHPSHHEGLPNAIIEAMAASLPVIATSVGGIPEAVRTAGSADETGWLVPPHDPSALSASIIAAAHDPARRAAMGERARVRVEDEFSLSRSVSEYEAIYRELAS